MGIETKTPVTIYDPNWMNPYGLELASVLAGGQFEVCLWCTTNRVEAPVGVKLMRRLSYGKNASLLRLISRRLFEPLSVVKSVPWRSPLILVWTRDPWDALVFGLRSALGGKTFFIYHNPKSIRNRGGLSGLMERFLLKVATACVVHSSRLALETGEANSRNICVAAHPPYKFTTRRVKLGSFTGHNAPVPVVAFLGALRPDKGLGDLLEIASEATGPWTLRILGPDRIPEPTEVLLRTLGVTCEYVGSGCGPSDDQLVAGLRSADVMIAPYRSVTESGSIHMALSSGVSVLAYESPGVAHILNEKSMASTPKEFGALLGEYLEASWPTYRPEAMDIHEQCYKDWRDILDSSS